MVSLNIWKLSKSKQLFKNCSRYSRNDLLKNKHIEIKDKYLKKYIKNWIMYLRYFHYLAITINSVVDIVRKKYIWKRNVDKKRSKINE